MKDFFQIISPFILAWIAYRFALNQARKNSLREIRLKTYSELIEFISNFSLKDHKDFDRYEEELIKKTAPARLIATEKTEILIRDYYDEMQRILDNVKKAQMPGMEKLTDLIIKLEKSMRDDLEVREEIK